MKEKVLEALRKLGFLLEDANGDGSCYYFEYEGDHYAYVAKQDEENLLMVALSLIIGDNKPERVDFNVIVNKLNSTIPYVKAFLDNGRIYFTYEYETSGEESEEDIETILTKMIVRVNTALIDSREMVQIWQNDSIIDDLFKEERNIGYFDNDFNDNDVEE